MFGCPLGQIRFRDPDFLSVELVEGTSVITGPKCNKGPSVITFEPKYNKAVSSVTTEIIAEHHPRPKRACGRSPIAKEMW